MFGFFLFSHLSLVKKSTNQCLVINKYFSRFKTITKIKQPAKGYSYKTKKQCYVEQLICTKTLLWVSRQKSGG